MRLPIHRKGTMKTLPNAEPQYPLCGMCYRETEWDGDALYCEACGLDYDPNTYEAAYRNPDQPPCGQEMPPEIHQTRICTYGPCPLPSGHTSAHYYPMISERKQR